jgi:hypothetical protein
MTSTKQNIALTSSSSGNTPKGAIDTSLILKQGSVLPYPTHVDDSEILGVFIPTEDYLEWREQLPAGYLLAQLLERNKSKIIGVHDKEVYEEEHSHIADPEDYVGTVPDNEIRWKI